MVLKKLGVTGASGMLGWHFLETVAKKYICVQTTSRTKPHKLDDPFCWQYWDLLDWKTPQEIDELFPNVQALVHIGALLPNAESPPQKQNSFDINVRSCVALAEWAISRNIPIVYISGAIVYENPYTPGLSECDAMTTGGFGGFYGLTKCAAEKVFYYFMNEGLKVCILRPSSIFGYGLSRNKMISKFLHIASQDGSIELYPPAQDRVNLIHAYDVCNGILQVLEKKIDGVFNLASPVEVSIEDIANTCIKIVGKGKVIIKGKKCDKKPSILYKLSCTKAEEKFGFSVGLSFKEGLNEMWNKINKQIPKR